MPRVLLVVSASIQAAGAVLHAAAFPRARTAFTAANLQPFFANSAKGLWLGDASTLFLLALVFYYLAVRPAAAVRPVVVLLALIPATTALWIYLFLGAFFAAHLLAVAAAAALVAGLQLPARPA